MGNKIRYIQKKQTAKKYCFEYNQIQLSLITDLCSFGSLCSVVWQPRTDVPTLRITPKEYRSHVRSGGSLKSRAC